MTPCPWYVSAHAVRRYLAIAGRPSHEFDHASDWLIDYAARTWHAYSVSGRAPQVTRTGAYAYRGPRPERLTLVVSMEQRPEGPKPALVDVVLGFRRRR